MQTVSMEIYTENCGVCSAHMVKVLPVSYGVFPNYGPKTQLDQMRILGLVPRSNGFRDGNGKVVCERCSKNLTFACCLCQQELPREAVEESFGDPPEYLCKNCYNSVPANVWDKKVEELMETHRYDFE